MKLGIARLSLLDGVEHRLHLLVGVRGLALDVELDERRVPVLRDQPASDSGREG